MDLLTRIREDMALEGNVWKSYAYRFLMNLQLWWPIWVIYLQRSRGLSLTQITLLDTPFFLLIVLSEVPTGAIADRFGRRVSLMLGSTMLAVAVVAIAAGAHQGWSANMYTLTSDMFPKTAVGTVVGFGSMAGAIGGIFAAKAVGYILQWTGSYAIIFWIASSAYLAALVIVQTLAPQIKPVNVAES